MLTVEKIKEHLQDRRLLVISEATGIHYATILAIKTGRVTNPSYETVRALSDYLTNDANEL